MDQGGLELALVLHVLPPNCLDCRYGQYTQILLYLIKKLP